MAVHAQRAGAPPSQILHFLLSQSDLSFHRGGVLSSSYSSWVASLPVPPGETSMLPTWLHCPTATHILLYNDRRI